jgi:O-antigen/teichoic acid export membrane protein
MMNNSGRALARNSLLNLAGQSLPILVALLAIPPTIRYLGTERFGLLSLAWVVLGYFTVFDLGLGRASTKYVAESFGIGDRPSVPRIVWSVAIAQMVLGLIGALVVAISVPYLTAHVLKIPAGLLKEAKGELYVVAVALPVMLLSASFSGVLEAIQRFDLVNAVKVPSSIMVLVASLIGAAYRFHLSSIVGLIVVVRLVSLIAFATLATIVVPELRHLTASWGMLKKLFGFGGWLTISGIVGPSLVYLDRFILASVVSMSAVTYYSAPYEALSRIWIIPGSIAMTLFPSFSNLIGAGDDERARKILVSSIKYLVLVIGPVMLGIVFFAHDILYYWLGRAFVQHSALAMQILAAGFLVNSLALIPAAFLQGSGRPDLTAKFHLAELPIHAVLAWVLVTHWGIAGAAFAWTTRVSLDALLLYGAVWIVGGLRWETFRAVRFPAVGGALAAFTVAVFALGGIPDANALPIRVAGFILVMAAFAFLLWTKVLDQDDRKLLGRLVRP